MTEAILESYVWIIREIDQLEGRLAEGAPLVADVVHSAAQFPYNMRDVLVIGSDEQLYKTWATRLVQAREIKSEIESFIESVADDCVRVAMRYRYLDGLPWQTVALRCGWQDKKSPQKKIKKYLSDGLLSPKPPL